MDTTDRGRGRGKGDGGGATDPPAPEPPDRTGDANPAPDGGDGEPEWVPM